MKCQNNFEYKIKFIMNIIYINYIHMNMILPTELMLEIYDWADPETRIKLNKIFGWSYYFKNPFHNINTKGNAKFQTLVMGTTFHRYASYRGATIILPM